MCAVLSDVITNHKTEPLFEAILGHRSAASLPTGPVMAEPFISPLGLMMTPALSNDACM